MAKKTGIQRAVAQCSGSPTRLAELIGDGVLRQHVEHWLKAGRVPPERAHAVNRVSGVSIRDLCPDVWQSIWPELAEREAPAKQGA